MNYLVYELNAQGGDVVQVTLDKQANVRLMDSTNYQSYRNGRRHQFHGGLAKTSPCCVPVPHTGRWYVTIDLGGYGGRVNASVRVV